MLNSIATESRIKPHGADGAGKKRARGVDVAKGERDVDNNGITNFSRYEINRNVYQEKWASRIGMIIAACDKFKSRTEYGKPTRGSGWCCAVARQKELMPDLFHSKIISNWSVPQQCSRIRR